MRLSCLLPTLLVASASLAPAALITITGIDSTRGGNVNFVSNGTAKTGYAGAIFGTYNGGPSSTFFCVDELTDITISTYNSTPIYPRTLRNEDRVAWLYSTQLASVTSATMGESLQLAIWDIVHDNGDGPTTGIIQASGSTPSAVVSGWTAYLLVSLGQSDMNGAAVYLNSVIGTGVAAQALLGPVTADTVRLPEPTTMVLSGSALFLLGVLRRRR